MEKAIRVHLGKLGAAVKATAIPAERKHAIAYAIEQLPALYDLLHRTDESRYDEKITRLFQGLMTDLVSAGENCPQARKLAAGLPEALRCLHEELGLPRIALKTPPSPPSRPLRVRKPSAGKKTATATGAKNEADTN